MSTDAFVLVKQLLEQVSVVHYLSQFILGGILILYNTVSSWYSKNI